MGESFGSWNWRRMCSNRSQGKVAIEFTPKKQLDTSIFPHIQLIVHRTQYSRILGTPHRSLDGVARMNGFGWGMLQFTQFDRDNSLSSWQHKGLKQKLHLGDSGKW